jgi:Ni/Co efflux regulator RcnB
MLKKIVVLLSILAFSKVAFASGSDVVNQKPEHEVAKEKHKKHEHHEKNKHEHHEKNHEDHKQGDKKDK